MLLTNHTFEVKEQIGGALHSISIKVLSSMILVL